MTERDGATGLAWVLGQAAAATSLRDLPATVTDRVLALVADVVAVMVSACDRPEIERVRAALHVAPGPATVVGSGGGGDPAVAAAVNAMPVAAEQLQDGHRLARGHPASHVVPAVLAVAESTGAGAGAMLAAVLAGYEVGARVGMAMGGTPDGVHDIATWGTIAAAAGVAHLRSAGDAGAIAAAVDLAAALVVLPDAATVFDGWTGQHLLLATGCQLGVLTGTAAASGLRAPPGTLERHFGRLAGRAFDPAVLAGSTGAGGGWAELQVLQGYLKRHPTCAHLHGVNDAVEDIAGAWHGRPDEIEQVEVATFAGAAGFADPEPRNDLAARFSIPYTVAVALATGRLDAGSFDAALLHDRAVRALAGRVAVRHDPALDAGYPAGRPAVVTVRLGDGRELRAEAGVPRGDGPGAIADAVVAAKARRLLERAVPAHADAVVAALASLGRPGAGIGPLTEALRRPWAR